MQLFFLLVAAGVADAGSAPKHNIVYIMTDDQDIELGGLTPMPKIRERLGEQGAVGESVYIATPICCPSRTETFSGRLYTNVVNDDLSGCMHVNSTYYIQEHSAALVPALQKAGYMTGGFGKIINDQQKAFKKNQTVGWDWLSTPVAQGDYFGPEHFEKRPNGSIWTSTLGEKSDVVDAWYQTAQIGNRSLQFIDAALSLNKPFFAYLGPHAPHYSADSPPWARDRFAELAAPRTPAYNTSVGQADKAHHVAQNPPLDAEAEKWIDVHFRDRWRAILGVDDMVGLVLDHLEARGVLGSTFVFFSSDHGYKLGEWRIGCSKQHPYESDVHIPFFARGPGVAPGTRVAALASNIDIAPTMIDIAGLPPNPEHDGNSLLPMLQSKQGTAPRLALEAGWKTSQLIVYLSVGTYYNDHAKLWVSGPAATPGTKVEYGSGPYKPAAVDEPQGDCKASENASGVGDGKCYFVDSQASNNWLALRVRNATHNFVFAETYGAQAMATALTGGAEGAKGVFRCIDGDWCQHELYDYGPINATEYPHYPVMTDERWCLENKYKTSTPALQQALHAELKRAYCSQRRLSVDRMDCGAGDY